MGEREKEMSDVVTDNYIEDTYRKKRSWIDAHSRRMGVMGMNPRIFFKDTVDLYFRKRSLAAQEKVLGKEQARAANKYLVMQCFEEAMARRKS